MLGFLRQLLMLFVGGMLLVVLVGMAAGWMTSLGQELDNNKQKILGSFIQMADGTASNSVAIESSFDFLHLIIPHNPFRAFVEGSGLQILFLSLVLGIAFSFGRRAQVDHITDLLAEAFDAFIRVMNFLILLMPFGLFFIFAKQLSEVTSEVLGALGKLIMVSIATACLLIFANIYAIKWSSGQSLMKTCKGLSGVLVMSFATQSGFVTMPRMIRDLKDHFTVDEKLLKVVIPLGINMSPQGTCLIIALFGVFFTNMYHVAITPGVFLILLIGSMMISMAISGMPAIVGISMIAGLLESISVPAVVSTVILMAVFPLLDPFITTLNCIGNCNYSIRLATANKPLDVMSDAHLEHLAKTVG
jgi:proton glutamate symport protein